ncbi:erythroid differentiation-related factor 1 [Pseudoliparis swirei]|uniref:erythroid differentiation-related factor 1 n=1 Tax=Pseudoliparis swirei TaxID=2059687 RepID=UPI0024BDC46E|nr:erythroid differentiation-related factor 1 [Pseudoliparis swirei]
MSASAGDREPGTPQDGAKEESGGPACAGESSRHDSVCAGASEIKSRAVVKYSAAPPPASYALLQEKTDLKLPPANWLRENPQLGSAGTTVLGSSSKSKPFSSFGMAYEFIDCIGDDVDVVSDSENIKKLLKIPFSKSHVSMAVHRVGRTLLLDELDIQELFMQSSQTGDWTWLKEFYQRLIDQKWQRKKKSKEHWYQKAILSKFLYYSINGDGAAEPVPDNPHEGEGEAEEYSSSWPTAFTSAAFDTEESNTPKQESVSMDSEFGLGQVTSVPNEQNLPMLFDEVESSQSLRNDFVRNIMWTFEDIHMLVGSNMPIFGGGRYPAVSLRLRDNNKPINILTGIDYWLDNLMCNVPELVMCFHVNGIVQKYEMIKTEDIPHLENSNFSTRVVKDIAQNILSFLKSNCTKEGHTYWLFKASGSDIVKLYDLTTLCEEAEEEKCQNPFTLPVAVLLYRVASNLMLKARQNRKHYGTIRTLLLNCVKLLDEERHPQIVASAHYMLSELFQLDEPPEGDEGESLRGGGSEDSYSDEDREEEEELTEDSDENGSYGSFSSPQDDSKAVAVIRSVGELSVPEKYKSTHQIRPSGAFPVSRDKEERCRHVLSYALKGLKAVDGTIKKESDLPAADPNTPIPLKYEDRSAIGAAEQDMSLLLERATPLPADQKHPSRSGMMAGSWQHRMKLQLFLKASKAYYVLSDAASNLLKYGRALRYIKLSLQCYDAYCSVSGTLHPHVLQFHSQCLSLCGDIQLMLAQNANNRAAYLEEYSYQTKEDQEILHSLHRESSCQAFNMATDLSTDPEYQLFVSSKCYEAAYELVISEALKDQMAQVLKRLGNIRNEMGVFYMNQAAAMQTEKEVKKSVSVAEQEMWKKSFAFFEKGMKDFEAIGDGTNTALLLCNTGRLMRICAQAHCAVPADQSRGEFSPEEALYYNKAIVYYSRAIKSLASRKNHPVVWDSVNWELSTTYFTLATLLQDYAPLSRKAQEQIEREVTEAMMKSLKYCDLQTESARQPLYQYRAATIHHRLASMYHSCFRNQVGDEHSRKQHRSLAELHYGKAVALFLSLKDAPCELLRTLLERVAFAEFTMAGQNSNAAKLKSLTGAVEIMAETRCAFQLIHDELLEIELSEADAARGAPSGLNLQEVMKLIGVFEPSFSFLLLQLIKLLTATKRKPSNKDEELLRTYKSVYSKLLRAEKNAPLLRRLELHIELLRQLTPHTGSDDTQP